jgi:hypothetical protein
MSRAAGIRDACRAVLDAMHMPLAEAERAAAIPDLDDETAAFVAARWEQMQRIRDGLERKMKETTP